MRDPDDIENDVNELLNRMGALEGQVDDDGNKTLGWRATCATMLKALEEQQDIERGRLSLLDRRVLALEGHPPPLPKGSIGEVFAKARAKEVGMCTKHNLAHRGGACPRCGDEKVIDAADALRDAVERSDPFSQNLRDAWDAYNRVRSKREPL